MQPLHDYKLRIHSPEWSRYIVQHAKNLVHMAHVDSNPDGKWDVEWESLEPQKFYVEDLKDRFQQNDPPTTGRALAAFLDAQYYCSQTRSFEVIFEEEELSR